MDIPIESIVSQGIFCILFCWLLFSSRKESNTREERLISHLEKTTLVVEQLSNRVDEIDINLKVVLHDKSNVEGG